MSVLRIEPICIWRDDAIVGESPVWCSAANVLYWVDIRRQKVQRFDPATGLNTFVKIDDIVTSVNRRKDGGFVLTLRREFAFFDWETGSLTRLGNPEPERTGNRFNEARCDDRGRLWAGTMGDRDWQSPTGALYRFQGPGTATLMRDKVIGANGTAWSADNRTMYHTESFRFAIYAYDFDLERGEIDNPRTFLQLDPDDGEFPDGLTVDAEGFVWSAHVGRGRICRYDPAGRLEREIQLPVTRGTSCRFGGEDFRTLYITTAQETLTPEQIARDEPLAGSLFACTPGVAGLPSPCFNG
jgi:sugar lactone lactonase YvrE